MVFSGRHGVSDAERSRRQRFVVDIEIETDIVRAAKSDGIADTVDYRQLRAIVKEIVTGEPAHLIETLAERIAVRALAVKGVSAVTVRLAKRPASMRPIDSAAVIIRRS